jgi:hypothetical protein
MRPRVIEGGTENEYVNKKSCWVEQSYLVTECML